MGLPSANELEHGLSTNIEKPPIREPHDRQYSTSNHTMHFIVNLQPAAAIDRTLQLRDTRCIGSAGLSPIRGDTEALSNIVCRIL